MFTSGLELHHRGLNQNGRILENIIFCLTASEMPLCIIRWYLIVDLMILQLRIK